MRFFNSKNVKIFPCSNRGTYSSTVEYEASETLDSVFDLESRLASEYNFTNLSGIINNKKSYVISFEQLPYPITRSQDPAHSHSFNEKGVCSCGVLSSGHTHQFNTNNICLGCGWEPDYLLKVVINGYYFEIITKKFPIFTVSSGTRLINDYKSILDSKLWITLQKTSLREADLHDSTRHTYQLGSMFARSYTGTHEAEKAKDEQTVANSSNYYLSQHFEILEPGSQQLAIPVSTIINGSIALNILDFPADHVAGSIEKEYYCSAIGITSNGNSLEPWVGKENEEAPDGHFKVLLERESGETEADVVLCCLDLADPANWLENLAAGKFLNSPNFSDRVEGPEELEVGKLIATSISAPAANLDIRATTIISDSVNTATIEAGTIEAETIELTDTISAPAADLTKITADDARISKLIVPSLTRITLDLDTGSAADDRTLKAEIDTLIDRADKSVKNELRGDLVLRAADTENGVSEIKLASDINFTDLYGTTPCLATSMANWSETAEGAWNPAIPTNLTLTGLKKEISCLTAAGGEPNKINTISLGETELTPDGDKHIDLAGKIKLEHLHTDDKNRVSTLEKIIGKTTFVESTDTSIVAEIADLKDSLKNLDNVMNFIGVISAEELRTYTGKNTYSETKNIEVGDVVVVSAEGGFNYLDKRYEDGTEFICTGVSDSASTWQEIGTCNLTTSSLKQLLGEDTGTTTRTGSIKERLCNVEDSLSDIKDETKEGTISYRIKTIEGVIGDNTDEDSLQGRLSSLEDLISDTGEIGSAITTNTDTIGNSSKAGSIIYRLDGIETTLGTDTTAESVLGRLTLVENTLSGTGGGADGDDEGETGGSLPERVIALEDKVSDIEDVIDVIGTTANESGTLTGRLNALETNSIVAAAKDITLDDFKTSIEDDVKDAVLGDSNFIKMVDESISGSVAAQTPGKVVDFILNDYDFANDSDFTGAVAAKVQTAAETELSSLSVADIEFPKNPADSNSEKIKIEDKVNEAFLSEVAEVNLDTLTFKPSPEGDDLTIATAVSNAFDRQIKAVNLDTLTFEPSPGEDAITIATAVSNVVTTAVNTGVSNATTSINNQINEVISNNITAIGANRALSDNENDTVGANITTKINEEISSDISKITADRDLGDDQTVGTKITSKLNLQAKALAENYNITDNDEAMQILSNKINGIFQQTLVLYAVAFNVNGMDLPTPAPMAALADCTITLPTLTLEGYNFLGWSTTKSEDNVIQTSSYVVSESQILHAIWQEDVPETED